MQPSYRRSVIEVLCMPFKILEQPNASSERCITLPYVPVHVIRGALHGCS